VNLLRVLIRVISQSECGGDAKSENVSPNFTEIIVVRHGETEWNADGRIQVSSYLVLAFCCLFFLLLKYVPLFFLEL